MALLAAGLAACTYTDSTAAKNRTQVQMILRERLAHRRLGARLEAAGDLICAADLLTRFYESRNFAPAWQGDGRPSTRLTVLVGALSSADSEGLVPSDYHLAKIKDLAGGVSGWSKGASLSAAARDADLDMLATDAFLTYGFHLSNGKVNPDTLEAVWQRDCLDDGLAAALDAALASGRVAETLSDLAPRHPYYAGLKSALASARARANKSKWEPLPRGFAVKKGESGPAARRLRRRLSDSGDLRAVGKKTGDAFDAALEAALRRFQARHGLEPSGVLDAATLEALDISPQEEVRKLELNLERWRWLPRELGERFIHVNVADFELEVCEKFKKVLAMKVVVGSEAWQTPDFSSTMTELVVNPFWTIPVPVLLKEISQYILQDPCYLSNNKMVVLRGRGDNEREVDPPSIDWTRLDEKTLDFRVRQDPGPLNVLGRLKFVFTNRFEIFLHDTPYQEDFAKAKRTYSHGCIRAEKPVELAAYVLRGRPGWDAGAVLEAIDRGRELKVRLAAPIPVHFLYSTAWVDDSGAVQFRPDIYGRDARLAEALTRRAPLSATPVGEIPKGPTVSGSNGESETMKPMKIVGEGFVFRGEKGAGRASCAFPGIAVLPGGRWVCGFRAAPTKKGTAGQRALIAISDDEGKTWPTVLDPFVPPDVEGRPGLFRAAYPAATGGDGVVAALCWVDHSAPSLPFFNEDTEGLLDTRIFLSESQDGGMSWSKPRVVDTAPFRVPTPLTGPVLVLPNGERALQFELNKTYFDGSPWRHAAVLMFLPDRRRPRPRHVIVGQDPTHRIFYWDQRPGLLADGSLLDLFWTYDRARSEYMNIHARLSVDNGARWSKIWDTAVRGQPAPPVSLPDGRTAMVYIDRTGAPAVKLRASPDRGKTWPPATETVLFQPDLKAQSEKKGSLKERWAEMEKFSLGLPATARLPNGDILVVFYAGPEPDLTDIRWLRIQPGKMRSSRIG